MTRAVGDVTASDLPHLSSPAGAARHALAAHFLRGCEHVLELGGHKLPITGFLTHAPRSVTSVDPKIEPLRADTLNGRPCRVRHIASKFQNVELDFEPGSYGLVMLGYSLKAYGARRPDDTTLFDLVDKAKTVVIDYAPGNLRAAGQMPQIIARGTLREICRIDMRLRDEVNPEGSWLAKRCFMVFEPL